MRRGRGNVQREVFMDIIGELVRVIKGKGEIREWLQQKVEENIELKFKLLKCGFNQEGSGDNSL